jgi:ATP adenylyltransferase
MDYIANSSAEQGCIFCDCFPGKSDRERLILSRSDYSLVMLNRYPYTGGHLMVAPLRHSAEPDDLTDAEWTDMINSVRRARSLLQKVASPDGFNIGMNLGKAAGAGVAEHLHMHIVPRWNGDSNFMTVVGDVRVIPEGLMAIYDQLTAARTGEV